jgi:hypothetical protein
MSIYARKLEYFLSYALFIGKIRPPGQSGGTAGECRFTAAFARPIRSPELK